MRWYYRFFRRQLTEKRLDAELRFHLEQRIADLVAGGMTQQEARRQARIEFGGLDQVKEECRDVGAARFVETLIQDLRYGLRQLRRNPGFTAVAVLTLALGIGANTAIFSVVNAVLLKPLPYRNPARLVKIAETVQNKGAENPITVSVPDFVEWRDSHHSFEDMAAIMPGNFDIAGDFPEKIHGAYATPNFFSMLGVKPLLGRLFLPNEGQMGRNFVMILSYSVWQQQFGSDSHIIGKDVSLNGQSYTVIGVLPQSFVFTWGYSGQNTPHFDIWVSLPITADMLRDREFHPFLVVARLKTNVGLRQAQSEMSTIARHIAKQYPATNRSMGVQVISLHDQIVRSVRPALLTLLGAVLLVLLIACVNLANLLFGRSIQRSREMSVRMAMGASRSRPFRQLLTESVLLAGLGGCLGFLLSMWGKHLLVSIIPSDVPRIATVAMDHSVVIFAVAITLFTAVIFGLSPVLASSNVELTTYLKEGFRTLTSSVGSRMAQRILVVSEMALALVLLLGAGLLIKSFWRLINSDLGFSPNNLLTMKMTLVGQKYSTPGQVRVFARRVLEQVNNLPGVRSVAISSRLPLSGGLDVRAQYAAGANSLVAGKGEAEGDYASVSDGYFHAMEIPILQGRGFAEQDTANSLPAVIINSVMARQLWPGKDPIGKRLTVSTLEGEAARTIVGIIGAVKSQSLEASPGAQIYVPYSQDPSGSMYVAIRTASSPERMARAVRRRIFMLDRNLPVENMMTMEQVLASPTVLPKFYTSVLSLFAMLALILAAVGIYGVMSHVVAQQTHEIGVRMALGADRKDVLKLILGKGLLMIFIGVALGITGALALTRFLSSLLYGVTPTDPLTFVAVSLILIAVSLVACYIPARRAAKVDPMVALRYE